MATLQAFDYGVFLPAPTVLAGAAPIYPESRDFLCAHAVGSSPIGRTRFSMVIVLESLFLERSPISEYARLVVINV